MEIPNVALVGYMRSGKDSVAACLRHLDAQMRQLSFAGALKREVAEALNAVIIPNMLPYTEGFFNVDENRPRFRPLLQWWGTDYRRAQDPAYWVKQTAKFMDEHGPEQRWVCTDGRFVNELTMLKKKGFQIVELKMDVEEVAGYLRSKGLDRMQIEQQLSHPSEREWQGFGKDLTVSSQFGNLPRLTLKIVTALDAMKPNGGDLTADDAELLRVDIEDFYAKLYPATYGRTS